MRQISEAQREAARRNGAKSRGPVTARGKAISSRNNFRRGLRSKFIDPAATPDPADCQRRFARLAAAEPPRSEPEESLLREIAGLAERLTRLHVLQCVSLDRRNLTSVPTLLSDEIRTSRRLNKALVELREIRQRHNHFDVRTPEPIENTTNAILAFPPAGTESDTDDYRLKATSAKLK